MKKTKALSIAALISAGLLVLSTNIKDFMPIYVDQNNSTLKEDTQSNVADIVSNVTYIDLLESIEPNIELQDETIQLDISSLYENENDNIENTTNSAEVEMEIPTIEDVDSETEILDETFVTEENVISETEKVKEDVVEKPQITKDNMFLSKDSNTSNQTYNTSGITINNGDGFTISKEVEDNILNTIAGTGKTVSFYICDPETNTTISYNAEKSIFPASAIKICSALLTCKMIDTGQISFEDMLTYESSMYSGGSGTIKYDKPGTQYTVRETLHRCINVSDNIAYQMLFKLVSREGHNNMIRELGGKNFINNWQTYGTISAKDLNLVWQELYRSDREKGEEIYRLVQAGETVNESDYSACAILNYEVLVSEYNFLENALPYETSNKSGFSEGACGATGVVYVDDDTRLIVTIMTDGENAQNLAKFNAVGGALNGAIVEYNNFRENQANNNISYEMEME